MSSRGEYLIPEMDWLSENHAIIECNKREVLLLKENSLKGNHVFFLGDEVANDQCIIVLCQRNQVLEAMMSWILTWCGRSSTRFQGARPISRLGLTPLS